jgi:hypothetical protein
MNKMMTREEWLKWIEKTWQECQESAWKEQEYQIEWDPTDTTYEQEAGSRYR